MTDRASTQAFDFAAFRTAFEAKDVPVWLAFYAPDAEWIEYRHNAPPRSPNVMRGHEQIGAFLRGVAGLGVQLAIADEVIGGDRIAFAVTATLPDGRRVIEHVLLHLRDGLIARQVDVEAWD
jgi:ketosteroid isomerase-like protein